MPNKAVAGASASTAGAGVAGAVVAVCLYNFGSAPPEAIVIAYTTIVSAVLSGVATFASVWFTKMEGL